MSKKRFPKTGVLYAGHIPSASMVKIGNSLYTSDGKGYGSAVIKARASNRPVLSEKKRKLETLKDRVLDTWRVSA